MKWRLFMRTAQRYGDGRPHKQGLIKGVLDFALHEFADQLYQDIAERSVRKDLCLQAKKAFRKW